MPVGSGKFGSLRALFVFFKAQIGAFLYQYLNLTNIGSCLKINLIYYVRQKMKSENRYKNTRVSRNPGTLSVLPTTDMTFIFITED